MPDDRVKQIIGVATDITERKRTEDQLRESDERMRLALAVGNGFWSCWVAHG